MDELRWVVTTVGRREDALALARAMVQARLAACAQVEAITSVYRWQGAVQEDAEFRIGFKTVASQQAALEAAILERHPYDLPALHALAPASAWPPYADWVRQNTGPADAGEPQAG